jgi:hypothetical protein
MLRGARIRQSCKAEKRYSAVFPMPYCGIRAVSVTPCARRGVHQLGLAHQCALPKRGERGPAFPGAREGSRGGRS